MSRPRDELVFDIIEAKTDIAQNIKLTNSSAKTLAYKVDLVFLFALENFKIANLLTLFHILR